MRLAPVLIFFGACGGASPTLVAARADEAYGLRAWQRPVAVEGGPGRLVVVEVPVGARVEVVPSSEPRALQELAPAIAGSACAAINGGFYDSRGAMGWVRHDGRDAAALRPWGGSGLLTVGPEGAKIVHQDDVVGAPSEGLQSIDRVVADGRSVVGPRARPDADARSAVAIRGDGTVLFALLFAEQAVVHETAGRVELGARSSSTGLSLAAWAELLARPVADGGLGAATALNLDGGYSTSASIHVGSFDLEVLAHGATINALRVCAGPDAR